MTAPASRRPRSDMTLAAKTVIAFASAARTATPTSAEFSTSSARGAHIIIDVTAVTDTPSVTPRLDGYDGLSGKWYTLLTGAAITATGTTVLKIYPGITAAANAAASDFVPNRCRLVMTHADSDSI